jgi:hypothetical protein
MEQHFFVNDFRGRCREASQVIMTLESNYSKKTFISLNKSFRFLIQDQKY